MSNTTESHRIIKIYCSEWFVILCHNISFLSRSFSVIVQSFPNFMTHFHVCIYYVCWPQRPVLSISFLQLFSLCIFILRFLFPVDHKFFYWFVPSPNHWSSDILQLYGIYSSILVSYFPKFCLRIWSLILIFWCYILCLWYLSFLLLQSFQLYPFPSPWSIVSESHYPFFSQSPGLL